jgi:hypothetical protein
MVDVLPMTTKKTRSRHRKWTKDCAEEEERLTRRTDESKAETSALELSRRPFSQDEHDVLRERLRQHLLDLADYKRRCVDDKYRR